MRRKPFFSPPMRAAWLALSATLLFAVHGAFAQEADPVWKREPFDRLVLKEEQGGKVFEIQPLTFDKGKRFDEIKDSVKIPIRLVQRPEAQLLVAKRHIAQHKPFLQIVMEECAEHVKRATEAKEEPAQRSEFDLAFEGYLFLLQAAPKLPGLKEAMDNYLYRNAVALFLAGKYDVALAVMEELYARNPANLPAVSQGLGRIFNGILQGRDGNDGYIGQKDWRAARLMLQRMRLQYVKVIADVIAQNEQKLSDLAAAERDAALAHRDRKEFLEAHEALRRMVKIWPPVPQGRETVEEITREYPLVVVGVTEQTEKRDIRSLTSFPARRTGRLLGRTNTEFQGYGLEGGIYTSPIGRMTVAGDDTQLVIDVNPELTRAGTRLISGYDLSHKLLEMATPGSPQYVPPWGALVSQMAVEQVHRVRCTFRQSHVLPMALLQTPLESPAGDVSIGGYRLAKKTPQESQFIIDERNPFSQLGQPAVVIERIFESGEEAVKALQRGDIDVLDRVPPHLRGRLANDQSLEVKPYAVPTIAMLLPNPSKPFTGNRTFRRAIQLAAAREIILNQVILRGQATAGCKPVSGPFPAGIVANDPMAYANDERLAARDYDPWLSSVLISLARNELSQIAKAKKQPEPKLETLTLAYPATEAARQVCQTVEIQLNQMQNAGLKCVLKELPLDAFYDLREWWVKPKDADADRAALAEADLLYTEMSICDPVVDAGRLLGENGVAGADNPYIRLALLQIAAANNWRQAREQLLELHRLVHSELVVIPLWQIVNHFAYRAGLDNVPNTPVLLYQDIEKWRIDPTARNYGDDLDG